MMFALARQIPLKTFEVATRTKVLDWEVPQEWKIRDAYIADDAGNRVVDYNASNIIRIALAYPGPMNLRLAN